MRWEILSPPPLIIVVKRSMKTENLTRFFSMVKVFVSFADDVSYSYHFFLKDYLGNVRVVYNEDREAEEVNHYYPFGGILASSTPSVQPYKYNGKELDRKGGLDWYDYGGADV